MLGQQLIQAMLLGDMKDVPEEIIFLYSRTGLIHLFSASGFHMAVALGLAKCATPILRPIPNLKTKEGISFLFCLLVMTFFGSVTGWSSPMVRAHAYTSLKALARWLGIRENKHWIFLLSLLVSSVLGKGSTLSFLLSACGMAGILYLPYGIWLGPWLATLPITIFYFHLFSLSSLLWNLLFGNLIAWTCLPLAITSLLLKTIHLEIAFLDLWAAKLAEFFTHYLDEGDKIVSLSYWVPQVPWLLSVLGLFLFLKVKTRWRWASLFLLMVKFLPEPTLSVLDIGQGDSIFLQTTDSQILIDTGPKGNLTSAALANLGVAKLNHLLITHPDLDHRGGIRTLSIRHRIQSLWLREDSISIKGGLDILESAERANIKIQLLERNNTPSGFQCWFAPVHERNDISPLCLATLKNKKTVLLTGDMNRADEEWYLRNIFPFPQADYLKIAHHGSRFSSSIDFLWASGAKVALISVGKKNRYGHPTQDALDRIRNAGMKIDRTDRMGNLNYY